jgi:membrane protein required for colicin V production
MDLTWADYLIVVVCVASALFGVWRGFAKEALSVVTWLAAIWLAWRFSWTLEPMLGEWVSAPELKVWAARAAIFIVVMLVGGLSAWLARELMRRSGLSGTDRMLGALFGLLRGAIVFGLAVIGLQLSGLDQDPWWQSSRLRPYGERIAEGIRYYAELGGEMLRENEIA